MSHAAAMIKSIKDNATLRGKDNRFRKAYINQTVAWKTKFQFKKATPEELLRSKKSNLQYIKNEKRKGIAITILATVIALLGFYLMLDMLGQIRWFYVY